VKAKNTTPLRQAPLKISFATVAWLIRGGIYAEDIMLESNLDQVIVSKRWFCHGKTNPAKPWSSKLSLNGFLRPVPGYPFQRLHD
jgi:hypothetical protein